MRVVDNHHWKHPQRIWHRLHLSFLLPIIALVLGISSHFGYAVDGKEDEATTSAAVPSYAVPFSNFCDLAIEGYCLGVSSLHGFSTLPEETLSSVFGPENAKLFKKDPKKDEPAAIALLRLFSLLQYEPEFGKFLQELPSMVYEEKDKKDEPVVLFLKKDPRKADPEHMKGLHENIQKAKEKSGGVFLIVNIRRRTDNPFNRLMGGHSLFAYDSQVEGSKYQFQYLDPNRPREPQTLEYDSKTKETKFSTDGSETEGEMFSDLIRTYSVDDAKKIYESIVKRWVEEGGRSDSSKAVLAFLKLPGTDETSKRIYSEAKLNHDEDLFMTWQGQIRNLHNELLKHYRFEKTDSDLSKIDRDLDVLVGFAAQAHMDRGCQDFNKFMHKVVGQVPTKESRSRDHLGKNMSTSLSVPAGIASRLFDKIGTWALADMAFSSTDGERKGSIPQVKRDEFRCISDVVLPSLAAKHESPLNQNSSYWPSILNSKLLIWLVNKYDLGKLSQQEKRIVKTYLKRIPMSQTLNVALALAKLSPEKLKEMEKSPFVARKLSEWKEKSAQLMQLLLGLQKEAFEEWEEELKNPGGDTLPEFATQRLHYLWKCVDDPEITLEEFRNVDPDFRSSFKTWLDNWIEFMDEHNLNNKKIYETEGVNRDKSTLPVDRLIKIREYFFPQLSVDSPKPRIESTHSSQRHESRRPVVK